ncbi:MAG TPA: hypothetical protein VFZ53_02135 [Polyangiaceae bacterium]
MKKLVHLVVVAFGAALVTFACGDDDSASDDGGGESGNGGSSAGTPAAGGQNTGGTAGGGRGGTAGRAGAGSGGGRGGTGGAGGGPVECSSTDRGDIRGLACDDENARCSLGKECCCGECAPSLECYCHEGRWSCYYTDFCAFTESCGGAGGASGQAGQAGRGS